MRSSPSFFRRLAAVFSFTAVFLAFTPLYADSLSQPLEMVKLPDPDWTWAKPDKDENSTRIMYPKKIGQAVNLRVHTYEVPVSAKAFLEQVRSNIMAKPDYQGAEIQLLSTKQVDGTTWDVFEIKRKDEINQAIFGRKPTSNVVMMIIYTGAGSYYQDYYSIFMNFMKSISKS